MRPLAGRTACWRCWLGCVRLARSRVLQLSAAGQTSVARLRDPLSAIVPALALRPVRAPRERLGPKGWTAHSTRDRTHAWVLRQTRQLQMLHRLPTLEVQRKLAL